MVHSRTGKLSHHPVQGCRRGDSRSQIRKLSLGPDFGRDGIFIVKGSGSLDECRLVPDSGTTPFRQFPVRRLLDGYSGKRLGQRILQCRRMRHELQRHLRKRAGTTTTASTPRVATISGKVVLSARPPSPRPHRNIPRRRQPYSYLLQINQVAKRIPPSITSSFLRSCFELFV